MAETLPASGPAEVKVNQDQLSALTEAGFLEMLFALLANRLPVAPPDPQGAAQGGTVLPGATNGLPVSSLPPSDGGVPANPESQGAGQGLAEAVSPGVGGKEAKAAGEGKGQAVPLRNIQLEAAPKTAVQADAAGMVPPPPQESILEPPDSKMTKMGGVIAKVEEGSKRDPHATPAPPIDLGGNKLTAGEGARLQPALNHGSSPQLPPALGVGLDAGGGQGSPPQPPATATNPLPAETSGDEASFGKKQQPAASAPSGGSGGQEAIWSQARWDFPQVMTAATARVAQEMLVYGRPELAKAKLKLEADGLGEIRANLVWKAGHLDASFQVGQPQAAQFLQQGLGELRDRLAGQQVPVGDLMVMVDDGQQKQSSQHRQQPGADTSQPGPNRIAEARGHQGHLDPAGDKANPSRVRPRDVNWLV